jgi:hypothetical protein
MPLVYIAILKGKSPEYLEAVTGGVCSAVIETMNFPLRAVIRSSRSTNPTKS